VKRPPRHDSVSRAMPSRAGLLRLSLQVDLTGPLDNFTRTKDKTWNAQHRVSNFLRSFYLYFHEEKKCSLFVQNMARARVPYLSSTEKRMHKVLFPSLKSVPDR